MSISLFRSLFLHLTFSDDIRHNLRRITLVYLFTKEGKKRFFSPLVLCASFAVVFVSYNLLFIIRRRRQTTFSSSSFHFPYIDRV